MAEPPSYPAVKPTVTVPIPPLTEVIVGAPGDVNGVDDVIKDCGLVPAAFTARKRT